MNFILGLLGTVVGIIFAVIVIAFIIALYLRKYLGKVKFKEILNVVRSAGDLKKQEYSREKDISGMTKLLEPIILRDFKDFNKNVLYNKIETNLSKIFNAIEEQNAEKLKYDEDLCLIYSKLSEQIKDMKKKK